MLVLEAGYETVHVSDVGDSGARSWDPRTGSASSTHSTLELNLGFQPLFPPAV